MFQIDPMSRTPVYEQIVDQAERFILVGLLKEGDQLPSVRSLSVELSVNPNTIQKAFSELTSRGLTISVPGRGSFISGKALDIIKEKNRDKTDDFILLVKKLLRAGMSEEELKDIISRAKAEIGGESDDRG